MGLHCKTPSLTVNDPRRLTLRSVAYWRRAAQEIAESRVERTAFDAAGRAVKQWDARLWALQGSDPQTPANLRHVYSLSGRPVRTDSVDAGTHIGLAGPGAEVVFEWDSRQTHRETEHDKLLRPVAVFEKGIAQPRLCTQRFSYGKPGAGDQALNQFGQLIRHDDPAGSALFDAFSITGHRIATTRHFTLDPVMPDWPEPIIERQRLLEPGPGALSRCRFGALGDVLELVDVRGNVQAFDTTLDGRLRACRLTLQSSAQPVLTGNFRYNAEGGIEQHIAGNGVQTDLAYRREDGVLIHRRAVDAAGKVLQNLAYDYDPMGNVVSIEDKAQPIRYFANQRIEPISRFVYDTLYQLSEATGWEAGGPWQGPQSISRADPAAISNYRQTYHYDAGGNLLELTHVGAQDHGRRLKAARYSNRCLAYRNDAPPTEEAIAAAFDARGNLLELDQGRRVHWNLLNQLQSISPVERTGGVDDQEIYVYDGNGQRVRKLRSLQTRARTVLSEVRYLPGLELRTDSGTGEILQVITFEDGLNSLRVLHWETAPPSGTNDHFRYQQTDHLGSVCLELAADARIISQEVFYPFGETASVVGDAVEVSYKTVRYSGKERDATGLYYYGYRYYVPWLQRWLNPDPAGVEADGLNLFRMVRNNPLTFADEYGEVPVSKSAVGSAIEIFESFKNNYSDTDRVLPYTMMREITQGKLQFKTAKASPAVLQKTTSLRFTLRHYSYNRDNKGAMPAHMEIKSNFSLVNSQKMKLGGKGGNTSEKDWTKAGNIGFTFFLLAINGEVNERRFLAGMTHFAEYDLEDDEALKEAFGDSFDSLEFFASPDVLDPKHSSDMSAVPMVKGRLKELKATLLGNSGISPVQVGRMDARTMLDSLDKTFNGTLEIKIPGAVKVGKWHTKTTTERREVA